MEEEKNGLLQDPIKLKERYQIQFNNDTEVVIKQSSAFVSAIHPSYLVTDSNNVKALSYEDTDNILETFSFYRIASYSYEKVDDVYDYLNDKMSKLITALYSMMNPFIYGVISENGRMSIVIGVMNIENETEILRGVIEGLLDGIELTQYKLPSSLAVKSKEVGLISGIPSVKIGETVQKFSFAPIMKSLNGQAFSVLVVARPVNQNIINETYNELISIKDHCFAVSKRNISRQQGTSKSVGETNGTSSTTTQTEGTSTSKTGSFGLAFILSGNKSKSKTTTDSTSNSEGTNYSKTITDAVNNNEGISADVQNGFALELMDYADKALERFRQGRSNGMWETAITYSANSKIVSGIIGACIEGELSRPNQKIMPLSRFDVTLEGKNVKSNSMIIPKILLDEQSKSNLCTYITSEELGTLCTLPEESVPNFELKQEKKYPVVSDYQCGIRIGFASNGKHKFDNMLFDFSLKDLARHTFVCGITGSGKTTTVKKIIKEADVPFLVIESAKKEYRNMKLNSNKTPLVYTLGKPEINCLRFNPFYIQCGVSPQMHIDFLKDLFNASFAFYGPMPYILEKCLQNIYKKKGWNLTLGYHPYLMDLSNSVDFFELDYMKKQYSLETHKYLFPTMQDLKVEIERYIEEEMEYEGEVAGNIKTAIKARLESLCNGAKGFMFNTHDYANMEKLLSQQCVFELEGLADDSDKAFALGLLIIFINEFRQVSKEATSSNKTLEHLLVIEEAHRLLKNVSSENGSEDMGNPKGKAVEHFTNMIAEMRSYGQGVIVAEQIPSKLAPDVIKNSSNKIIQRLVSVDDQQLVANTIGINAEDSINLGQLKIGLGLCHKEGMALPVMVQIIPVNDVSVTDGMLYSGDVEKRIDSINLTTVKEVIADSLDLMALKMLNSLLLEDEDNIQLSIQSYKKDIQKAIKKTGTSLLLCNNEEEIYLSLLANKIVEFLLNGTYSAGKIVDNEFVEQLNQTLLKPTDDKIQELKSQLKRLYKEDPSYKAKYVVSQLVYHTMRENTDISNTIKNYFYFISENNVRDVEQMIRR